MLKKWKIKKFGFLLPKQGYKQIGLIDIYKQYAIKEINGLSVMPFGKSRNLSNFDFWLNNDVMNNKFDKHS